MWESNIYINREIGCRCLYSHSTGIIIYNTTKTSGTDLGWLRKQTCCQLIRPSSSPCHQHSTWTSPNPVVVKSTQTQNPSVEQEKDLSNCLKVACSALESHPNSNMPLCSKNMFFRVDFGMRNCEKALWVLTVWTCLPTHCEVLCPPSPWDLVTINESWALFIYLTAQL